jgi:hypothetical protein
VEGKGSSWQISHCDRNENATSKGNRFWRRNSGKSFAEETAMLDWKRAKCLQQDERENFCSLLTHLTPVLTMHKPLKLLDGDTAGGVLFGDSLMLDFESTLRVERMVRHLRILSRCA